MHPYKHDCFNTHPFYSPLSVELRESDWGRLTAVRELLLWMRGTASVSGSYVIKTLGSVARAIYCKLPKYAHSICTLLWSKGGVCLNIQLVLCIHSCGSSWCYAQGGQTRRQDWLFGKTAASLNNTMEISGSCCDNTKPRGIETTCIVSGDRDDPVWVHTASNNNFDNGQWTRL